MKPWTLYYNPKCGTCVKVKTRLEEKSVPFRIVEYLKTPPTSSELRIIAEKLLGPVTDLARKKEAYWKENGVDPETLSTEDLCALIAKNPALLERPVVVTPDKALVARPPEVVEELFKD